MTIVWRAHIPAQVYVMWLNLIFNIVLPLTSLVILNKAIYKKLSQVRQVTYCGLV